MKRVASADTLNQSNGGQVNHRLKALENLAKFLSGEVETLVGGLRVPEIEQGINFYDEVGLFETYLIKRALALTGGNQSNAARLLGLKATTLHAKIRHYNLSASYFPNLESTD